MAMDNRLTAMPLKPKNQSAHRNKIADLIILVFRWG